MSSADIGGGVGSTREELEGAWPVVAVDGMLTAAPCHGEAPI